jgi:hypothetical protein
MRQIASQDITGAIGNALVFNTPGFTILANNLSVLDYGGTPPGVLTINVSGVAVDGGATGGGGFEAAGHDFAAFDFRCTGAPLNAKIWNDYVDVNGTLNFTAASDDWSANNSWMNVTRSSATPTSIAFTFNGAQQLDFGVTNPGAGWTIPTNSGLWFGQNGSPPGTGDGVDIGNDGAGLLFVAGPFDVSGTGTKPGGVDIYNAGYIGPNWEIGTATWSVTTNVFTVGTQKHGTGITRNMEFIIGNVRQMDYGITHAGMWTFPAAGLLMTGSTVTGLPAAGNIGRRGFVTDANATTFGTIVAAGGANKVPVYDDGTNWRIG